MKGLGIGSPPNRSRFFCTLRAVSVSLVCSRLCWVVLRKSTEPAVAIHDSEYTRALESTAASPPTPSGVGTTGKQWWIPDWGYFTLPDALQEAFRSDGTPYRVLSDSTTSSRARC